MAQPALPIANLDLLIKLMMMTTSPNDGEALTALRKATAAMDKVGITWESLLRGKVTVIADPFTSIPQPRSSSNGWTPPSSPRPTPTPTPQQTAPPWTRPTAPPRPPTPKKPTRANPASVDQL